MKRLLFVMVAAAVTGLAVTGLASAAVSLNPATVSATVNRAAVQTPLGKPNPDGILFNWSTHTGIVYRSTVQSAFGWTDKQMARNKQDVTFTFYSNIVALYRCSSGAETASWMANDYSEAVIKSKFQGDYTLLGDGDILHYASLPGVGDSCPNGDGSTIAALTYQDAYPDVRAHYGEQWALIY
jgi:hypothetical protein